MRNIYPILCFHFFFFVFNVLTETFFFHKFSFKNKLNVDKTFRYVFSVNLILIRSMKLLRLNIEGIIIIRPWRSFRNTFCSKPVNSNYYCLVWKISYIHQMSCMSRLSGETKLSCVYWFHWLLALSKNFLLLINIINH